MGVFSSKWRWGLSICLRSNGFLFGLFFILLIADVRASDDDFKRFQNIVASLIKREDQIKTAALEYESVTTFDRDGRHFTELSTGVEKYKLNKAFSFSVLKNISRENNISSSMMTYARYWNGVNSYQWNIGQRLGVVGTAKELGGILLISKFHRLSYIQPCYCFKIKFSDPHLPWIPSNISFLDKRKSVSIPGPVYNEESFASKYCVLEDAAGNNVRFTSYTDLPKSKEPQEVVEFDVKSGYFPVKVTQYNAGISGIKKIMPVSVAVAEDLREVAPGIWLPFHVKTTDYSYDKEEQPVTSTARIKVKKWEINGKIDDAEFTPKYPNGTRVIDNVKGTKYTVAEAPEVGRPKESSSTTSAKGPKKDLKEGKEQAALPYTMRIRVIGPEGQPMVGAKIHAGIWTKEPFKSNWDYECDSQGLAIVKLPRSLDILRLWARADHYVPLFANWDLGEWKTKVPEEFTFKLTKGTVIGGFIKNEDDQPIQNAHVEVIYGGTTGWPKSQDLANVDIWLATGDDARVTDAQGRWTLDNVPPGDDVEVSVKLNHPDYVGDSSSWGERQHMDVSKTLLRQQTATLVMKRGVRVTGSVVDPQGKPAVDAVVVWGDDPYTLMVSSGEVRTDAKGMYRLPVLPFGPMTVTLMAEGWAPDLKKITITRENPTVNFQLKHGKTLRLQFVDDSGKPVPDVAVRIAGWRGGKSLYNDKHPNVLDAKIPSKADKNGKFEWSWAPPDQVEFSFWKEGYQSIQAASYAADGVEHQIKLSR